MSNIHPQRNFTIAYHLDAKDPHFTAIGEGVIIITKANGESLRLEGGAAIPCNTLYFPNEYERMQKMLFMRWLLSVPVKNTALVISCVLALSYGLLPLMGVEAYLYTRDIVAFSMTVVLSVLFGCAVVALVVWNIGRGIKVGYKSAPMDMPLLESGEINIAPDVMVYTQKGDTDASHAGRAIDAIEERREGQWVVILKHNAIAGTISTGNGPVIRFYRDTLCRDLSVKSVEWPSEVPTGLRVFGYETESQFESWCNGFARLYVEWAEKVKFELSSDPEKQLLSGLKLVANKSMELSFTLALCLLSFFLSAQTKSEVVQNYLGERWEKEAPTGKVCFHFQKEKVCADGDGKKSYADLLTQRRFHNERMNMGPFIGITVDGAPVMPSAQPLAQRPAERPKDLFPKKQADVSGPTSYLPDSTETARQIRLTELRSLEAMEQFERVQRQWSGTYALRVVIFGLFFIWSILLLFSRMGTNESRVTFWGGLKYGYIPMLVGNYCTGILFIASCIAILPILCVMAYQLFVYGFWAMIFVFLSWHTFYCALWLGVIFAVESIMDWLIPNPKTDGMNSNAPGLPQGGGNYPSRR